MKRKHHIHKATLLKLLDQGLKSQDIAAKLGVSYSTLERRAKEYGLKLSEYQRKHNAALTKEKLTEALKNIGNTRVVAEHFRVSRSTLIKYIRLHGIDSKSILKERREFRKLNLANKYFSGEIQGVNRDKIREYLLKVTSPVCALCTQGPTWNNMPLTLQVDHINGVREDNRLENLRLLCPNCHSQTPTWGSKNRRARLGSKSVQVPLSTCEQPACDHPTQVLQCSKAQ